MKKTMTIQKEIPVVGNYDVVVCGGGPSGIMAAIAAARGGAKTAIIERYGFFGGMATAGLVAPISEFFYNGELVIGGIPWEFVQKLEAFGGAQIEMPLANVSFSPEAYKLISQRMLLEAGVTPYLHAYISDCQRDENILTHVVIESKSGTEAIAAKYFIDCTGDGDLAAMANVPMSVYSKPLQPASLMLCLGGVDTDKVENMHHKEQGVNYHIVSMQQRLKELSQAEDVPNFGGPWMMYMMADGMALMNITRIEANMIDEREQTRAECTLREDAHRLVALLRKHFAPFKNALLLSTATQTGVRETRHIKGVHTLSGNEYISSFHFPDSIARGAHPVDIHASEGSGQRCEFLKEAAYIPYRSTITEGFPNILVGGRSFSADQEASASARVQSCVMGIGQAVGFAAAMACQSNCSVMDVDVHLLRDTLTAIGANI